MKKLMLLAVAMSCLWIAMAVPASAQMAKPVMLKGEVPFAFVSGEQTLQAGQYSIEVQQSQIRFLNAQHHPIQVIFTNPQQDNSADEQPRLVFHQYGGTYFLWQIWTRDHKVDFRTSRAEYSLKASLKADQETIILAMR